MLQNYFKIAWRHLLRHKSYAFINLLGLTLGITCGILIFTLVTFELGYDTFHPNKDRIYRIVTDLEVGHRSFAGGIFVENAFFLLVDKIRVDLGFAHPELHAAVH